MSSNIPPTGPRPEYLEQGSGAARTPRSGGRRSGLVAGGAVAGLLLVGGGIWAATWYFGSGPQPAEALPDTTLGYVSIDLDPSGAQKIEALRTLNKFPAIKEQLDLGAEDDVRRRIFEEIQQDSGCADLDYGDEIEPWLGSRAAVAAVDTGGEQPAPVFVLQVSDADKADAGLTALRDCAAGEDTGDEDSGGWAIEGGWAVLAESDDVARQVVDDAADAPLTDDEDYQRWTGEVGDAGVVSAYAAPAAGKFLADDLAGLGSMFGGSGSASSCTTLPDGTTDPFCEDGLDGRDSSTGSLVPSEVTDALEDFEGAAATIRFQDGSLELEVAGDPSSAGTALRGSDQGDEVITSLPEDTAAAVGVGLEDGWFSAIVDQMASDSGGPSAEDLMAQLSQQSGLDLPDDAETLLGDSAALAVGSDIDPEQFFSSTDGSGLPIALAVKGDPDGIEEVLDKIRGQMPPDGAEMVGSDAAGDTVAIGPDADYRASLLEGGDLGDSEVFRHVVPDAGEASAVLFVDFDAGDGWLTELAGDDPETVDNLEPLEGLGMSVRQEDDAAHAVLRLTTD